jgi:hypothetical protein
VFQSGGKPTLNGLKWDKAAVRGRGHEWRVPEEPAIRGALDIDGVIRMADNRPNFCGSWRTHPNS